MSKELFSQSRGVIPACDFLKINKFEKLIKSTYDIEGIVGFKIGCGLALKYSLTRLVNIANKYTDSPIIYDHQKGGTDIPQMGEIFSKVCSESGVRGVIIFPQSGPSTEEAFIKSLYEEDLIPIVGGEMTHPKYLERDGGFIRNDAPAEIYDIAAKNKVNYFVIPGNKPDIIKNYSNLISRKVEKPKYIMPGIGRQGGDIGSAFKYLKDIPAYVIVGASIYGQDDMRAAAIKFCSEVHE